MTSVGGDGGASEVFETLHRHVASGIVLAAKIAGQGAVETAANGAVVRLSDGREAIDFGSYAVTLLGHRHPDVVAAVADQLGRMTSTTRLLANPVSAGLMADLARRFEPRLQRVWLGSDGADAVEVSLKLARRRTGRLRVLAVHGAFHGKTLGALALTSNPIFHEGLEGLLSHVTHIEPDDPDAVAREVEQGDVAALVVEPIRGEGGVQPLDADILRRWAVDARDAGSFVISDEIQVGLRRCGATSLAVEAGIDPDAVLLGKPLGGGVMPLAAMIASDDLYAPLMKDPTWHSQTFSGHVLSCAAGRAALRAIDHLAPAGARVGERLEAGLRALARQQPELISAVRGKGLLWGVEFANAAAAGSVLVDMAMRGVLISPCLSAPRTIRLLPPMVATDEQVDVVLGFLAEVVQEASSYLD
ncbi:MAG TPA: aspartate aminotransferase family protein [Solirubrobacteraceae bacterium]|nr:aspartate aminotransferase family protein [Solirubrobacteraceae bacterium]